VLWVYYCLGSLQILRTRYGFKLTEHFVESPQYSLFKSHRYMIFKKTDDSIDTPSIDEVRIFNGKRLNALFQSFTETMPTFGRSDLAIVRPLNLLRDLARVQDFRQQV
jgi:hypothetical protein